MCVIVRESLCSDMEVAHHFVTAPTAHEFDDVGVDATKEECHGSARAEASHGDFVSGDAQGFPNNGSAVA